MKYNRMNITILGLSITSSWGNGHATTFRGLVRELAKAGHKITFLERDVPWYASQRDLAQPPYCETILYKSLDELRHDHASAIKNADLVIVGSYVPQGIEAGELVLEMAEGIKAFYDIDTPVTLAALERGDCEYLAKEQIARYDLYLSFTGGPTLDRLEKVYGSPMARPLYCSFDPEMYFPEDREKKWDLGYLGTYSADRQPPLENLLIQPAQKLKWGKFVVAGPQYPAEIEWPQSVERIEHIPPSRHREFYNSQCFTLNITRADMIQAGYAPSVRLFEAAACCVPIISDYWDGLDHFFSFKDEILIARTAEDTVRYLKNTSEAERRRIGENARKKVLTNHTARHRALELVGYAKELDTSMPAALH